MVIIFSYVLTFLLLIFVVKACNAYFKFVEKQLDKNHIWPLNLFVVCSIVNILSGMATGNKVIAMVIIYLFSIVSLGLSIVDIRWNSQLVKKDSTIVTVIELFNIITVFSFLARTMYFVYPESYQINTLIEGTHNALQFWFYSFHVAITYSDGLITAVRWPAQLLQVCEIIMFYIVLFNDIVRVQEYWKNKKQEYDKNDF